ncbi:hypothetical protein NBRC3222_2732 [Acetobacter pasteurianus NBRC 3222]|nr:hypothetical protein NBRC3222_2732 [Acetobacter pasteurianus NBRC 3222]
MQKRGSGLKTLEENIALPREVFSGEGCLEGGENEPAARDWCGVQVCHHGVSDLFYLELS